MVIISHPTSNANSRAAVNALEKENLLYKFYTGIAAFPNSILYKLGSINTFSEIKRRSFPPELEKYTESNSAKEIGRLLTLKLGLNSFTAHEKGAFCVDKVYEYQDKLVAKKIRKNSRMKFFQAVYAYEDGAYYSFKAAQKSDIKCLYDLPIGYYKSSNRLLSEEKVKFPEYASTLSGLKDSKEKLERKDKELEMADHILVASTFTASTLKEYSGTLAPIKIIPYGFPKVAENRTYTKHKKLKALFVGGLSQRKGIAYIFEAAEILKDSIELTIVGSKTTESCHKLDKDLQKFNWIPSLANDEILELMRNQDVLLFPSLFEGFGMVITEAMSQGTPVITTERTAGPDLITHNQNGWIIEAGSTAALIHQLEVIIANPSICEEVGLNALETARKRPWEVYGKELTDFIKEILQ